MLDFTVHLTSLGFEAGLSEEEKELLVCLRGRAAGLTVSGCAHAVFAYELFRLLRKKVSAENGCSDEAHLYVGILGGGQMCKQLATALLHASSLKPHHINISTKRPETSGGLFLDQRWVSAELYSLLNMCTTEKLGSGKTLQLLNRLFETKTCIYHSFPFSVDQFG